MHLPIEHNATEWVQRGGQGGQEGGYFGRQEATIETIQAAPTPVTEEGRGSILFAGRC